MKRVLVTGGTGFIGANLVRRLVHDGHDVHLILRDHHDPWRLRGIADAIHPIPADVEDADGVLIAITTSRPDWIFNLAAYGAYPSQTDPTRAASTNVVGTVNLLEAAAHQGFEAFVNAGTSSEYGRQDHAPREDEPLEPASAYATTKAAATLYCQYAGRCYGERVVTLRLYSAYGPYEEPSRLLPRLIVAGLDGQLPSLAAPDVAHDYVHVDDVCEAFVRAAQHGAHGGTVYNVATGVQTTLRELVALARDTLGVSAGPVWGSFPDRPWDTPVWIGNATKIRTELGWEPRYDVARGFRAMVSWLSGDPSMLDRYRRGIATRAVAAPTRRVYTE